MVEKWQAALTSYQAEQWDETESLCREMISHGATSSRPPFLLGVVLGKIDRWPEAAAWLLRAESLDPAAPEILSELGRAHSALGEFSQAADCYKRYTALKPDNPNGHFCWGNACQQLGNNEEAVKHYQRALKLNPQDSSCWNNLGMAQIELQQLAEAVSSFDQALTLRSDFALAHRNRAIALLKCGRLQEGWLAYEWRLSLATPRPYSQPLWDGKQVNALFIHAEQGLGDSIQFVRYLRMVRPLAQRLILECQPPLKRWFEHSRCADEVVAVGETPTTFDAFIPLLSLPRIFRTTLGTIPGAVPYLTAPTDKQLPAASPGRLKVGFVWAGNPQFRNDANRSLTLSAFLPVLQVASVSFYSFQLDAAEADRDQLQHLSNVVSLVDQMDDFAATAGLARQMDLLITVDTALAHLAGALGKSVWTLLPFSCDWRWLVKRADTPWYPTMRLFRQPKPNDWASVVAEVAKELQQLAVNHSRHTGGRVE